MPHWLQVLLVFTFVASVLQSLITGYDGNNLRENPSYRPEGSGGILYTIRGGTPSYTHENKRGDVVAKTDGTGALTYQAQYEAFGKQTATNGSTLDRQKSNSKDTDPTGLVDEGFRYRDLDTGMFLTRDPAGFVDGPNLYTYVRQNPWTAFDPEGLYDNFVTQAEQGAYNLTHQSIGQSASALGIPQAASQAATGFSRLVTGDTHAMGASLQQTGAGIKQTAANDVHLAGVGAQRLATGNVSAMDLADAGGRGLMNGIMAVGPAKGLGAPEGATLKLRASMEGELGAYQKAAADGKLVQTSTKNMPSSSARKTWEAQNGPVPEGYDVDHIIQRQHGGTDELSNLQLKESGQNRSEGSQAYHLNKENAAGTKYTKVKLVEKKDKS
jgi:RHS repeat-associated protein